VRTDTYACANHSAAFGSIDNVAYSGIGGEVIIDPTYVRYVAFTGGSGNSPAFGAAISQGGVSGVFLGVWANWQNEPIVPGAAIPASGFIKVGGVTGGAFSAGALTGITATCSGVDLQCWLEVRCAETATLNVSRVGEFRCVETWFYLESTNGSAGQIIPCPTTGTVAQVWPGVWVETAPSSNVYERFVGAGAQVPLSTTPTDARAKLVWQTTSGLRLGSDGTNNVGYLPPAGCRVRIPASILTNCIRTAGSGSGPRVVPNATLGTRAEFNTTSSGYIDIAGAVIQWAINLNQAFFAKIKSCAISDNLWLAKLGSAMDIDDIIVAPTQSQAGNIALVVTQNFLGGTVKNASLARFNYAGSVNGATLSLSKNVTFDNVVSQTLTARTNTGSTALLVSQTTDCSILNCTFIGAPLGVQGCVNTAIENMTYADGLTDTTTTNAISALFIGAGSVSTTVDGIRMMPSIANVHPYTALISVVNCSKTKIRNVGSFAAPVDAGSANKIGLGLTISGNDGVDIKRVYFAGLRQRFISMTNSDINVFMRNCAGDYSDVSFVAGLNCVVSSFAHAGATAGNSAVYGSHWVQHFTSATAGLIEVLCNEPTAQSAAQCAITSGSPLFNSGGAVLMTVTGQQIIWEMPEYALGYTALSNSALSLTGTNTGNLSYEFQYNIGAGYNGTWLTANATNFTTVGAIDPAVGIKIKLRVTCVTANAGNVLTNIRIVTVTTSTAQSANLYPLSYAPISVSGLTAGSRVKFSKVSDNSVLYSAQESSGVVNFNTNEYVGAVSIEARNASSAPYYLPWVTQVVTVDDQTTSAIALQQLD
jgi:hypothetical protein